jgi:low affinity Fe/Cu permease
VNPATRPRLRALRALAACTPAFVGSPWAFLAAIVVSLLWLVWGVFADFSDRWLLVPSAVASVVTFLIAFSLQYTQNRDTRAIQLKLDEILRVSAGARSELVKLEQLPDDHLARIEEEILELRDEQAEDG